MATGATVAPRGKPSATSGLPLELAHTCCSNNIIAYGSMGRKAWASLLQIDP